MDTPKLSVCIPTYNCAHFLPDAIGSVLRQKLDDFEIVIVDNASEDNTEEVVRGFECPQIRYFRNSENLGPHHSAKRCLLESTGANIKYLCADDVFVGDVLAKQMQVLDQHPNVSLVTCNLRITDQELRSRAPEEGQYRQFPGTISGTRMINACLSGLNNYIGGPSSIMYRRHQGIEIPSGPIYKWVGDLHFGLKLLERGDYFNIDQVGILYRRHPNTDTAINCPETMRMPEYFRLADEFDWWNPLNCIQAIRRGGSEGKAVAVKNSLQAAAPQRILNAVKAFGDVRFMRSYSHPPELFPAPSTASTHSLAGKDASA